LDEFGVDDRLSAADSIDGVEQQVDLCDAVLQEVAASCGVIV
jgi:hypothetical protein